MKFINFHGLNINAFLVVSGTGYRFSILYL